MQVELITTIDEFESIQKRWDITLQDSSTNSIFLTHTWLHKWLRHYGKSGHLYVLMAHEGDKIVGIAPLMIRNREGFRRLASIGQETLDHENWILVKDVDHGAVVRALTNHILADQRWDLWQFNRLPAGSITLLNLQQALPGSGMHWCCQPTDVSPYIETIGEWKSYWQKLPKVFRSNFERRVRKLKQECGPFTFADIACEAQLEKTIQALFDLHHQRHAIEGNASSYFDNPQTSRFYASMIKDLYGRGWLRMPSVAIQGKLVAIQLGLEYAGTYYSKFAAFDPSFAKYAVGDLLNVLLLQQCFEGQTVCFDFLRGSGDYKLKFEPTVRDLYALTVFAPTVRGTVAKRWFNHLRPFCKDNRIIKAVAAKGRSLLHG